MSRRAFFKTVPLIVVLTMVLVTMAPAFAAPAPPTAGPAPTAQPAGIFRGVSTAVKFDVSPPLSSITPLAPQESKLTEIAERATGLEGAWGPQDADAALQTTYGPSLIPAPSVSFNGPGNISSVSPPDSVGDVGPNHYVAMSNLSFQVFDKAGNSLYGPALNNTLWAGFGGDCQTDNSGDPIVLHDQISDRWMLSQFTASGPTYFNCVAISQTPDPTGAYYRYAFSTGTNFPDYPKYGFWSDALYISTRDFAGGSTFVGIGAYAINRAQLIAGNPAAQVISFLVSPASAGGAYNIGDGLLPADLDGSTLPPAGTPNFWMGSMDNGGPYGAPQDALTLWKFTADFVTPANSTFVLANTIPIAAYDTMPAFCSGRACVPQPGTANKIDHLGYRQRPTWRLAYRNFGTHESLVTNQSIEASATMSGIRWWEVRSPNSSPVLYQDATYAPGLTDGIHRWMGSIAQDSAGNMALGYSASNGTTTFPSSWYTGRLAGDPVNTMPQGEGTIINGTGSQTGSQRWGDYTSMNIDPVDDCTFWYVNEWVPTTSSVGWQLRIGAFKFNECGTADFTLAATPDSQEVCVGTAADYTVNVGSVSGYTNPVTLSASGNPGSAGFSVNPVVPPGSSVMTISGAAVGNYTFDVVGTAAGPNVHQDSVSLDVVAAAPAAPALTSPANNATSVPVAPTYSWSNTGATSYTIEVATDNAFTNIVDTATVAGTSYNGVALNPGTTYYWRVGAGNACGYTASTVYFTFTTAYAAGQCGPGATQVTVLSESFEGTFPPAGWTLANSTTGCTGIPDWTNTDPGARGNLTGGTGLFAVADSDDCGSSVSMNAQMWTSVLDLTGLTDPAIEFKYDYNDLGSADSGAVDVSTDGGSTWANEYTWTTDARGPATYSDAIIGAGENDVVVRWHYVAGWDWWWEVDEVVVTACEPSGGGDPNIDVSPLSLAANQPTNTTTSQNLAVGNTGTADLNWTIFEDATAAPELVNWSDNFDSYATGSQLIGQGGWEGWDNSAAAGALTSSAQALSAPNSADILGGTDLVHQYSGYTSGKWVYKAMQYIPSNFSGQNYFILLNTYAPLGVNNWSFQLCADSATGMVYDDIAAACTGGPSLPMVTGQWVEIRVEIDLDADTMSAYYNNQLLIQDSWTNHVSGGGAANIGAVDLFANNATSVFYDDMSLTEVVSNVACDAPADIPWASVNPTAGTTTPAGSTNVQVTFDSTSLAVGVYTGNLCVESNDPDPGPGNGTDLVIVPLTLTVQPPTAVTLSSIDAAAAQSPVPMAGLPLGAVAAAGISMAAAAGYVLRRRK